MASKHLTRAQAREKLGDMPERTLARLVTEGLPRRGDKFLWPEIYVWVMERERRKVRDAAKPDKTPIADSEARQEAAKAELLELKLAEQQGRLMTTERYAREIAAAFERVAAQAKAMKKKLAPEVLSAKTATEAESIIDDHVRAMLAELCEGADIPESEEAV
mgnify:CR=1 FL=1